jgi:hypothetical protein
VLGLSLLLTLLIRFLHGLPPLIVVSIADVLGALIILVMAIIWAILVLFGALVATVKALRPASTRG